MRKSDILKGFVVGFMGMGALVFAGCSDSFAECDASATCVASEEGAVFVSAKAATGGDGTKAKPYKTLQEGIDHAGEKQVYACGAFTEAVTLAAGIEVIGGFDCDGWTWRPESRSTLEAPADKIALTLTETAEEAKVLGFAIRAADATVSGGSSIAVAVADVHAVLLGVEVTAGNGMDGEDGTTPTEEPTEGASAPKGDATGAPTDACVAEVAGGKSGVVECDDSVTHGGAGGDGGISVTASDGQAGENGEPLSMSSPAEEGLGGKGATGSTSCADGKDGQVGAAGAAGPGGARATLMLTGITGGDGVAGHTGTRGQGGGGGGGAKAGVFCPASSDGSMPGVGASGGGGGAGGCGGKGGGGGRAGGSSIGILSLGTQLELYEVTVTVGQGGKGGNGSKGQNGANGGSGAPGGRHSVIFGSTDGCDGGDGGDGGPGGPGGGGRGGYAVGVAFARAPSHAPALKRFAPGTEGLGGTADASEGNGAPGGAGACWDFSSNAGCAE